MLLEFLKEVDQTLKYVFFDDSLEDRKWFETLEKIVLEKRPEALKHIEGYELVRYYVKFKQMEILNEQSNRT